MDDDMDSELLRKLPSQDRSRDTVNAILEAARQIVRRDGLGALSVKRLASRAGVSPGTLYQYFEDLDAVVAMLAHRRHRQALESAERAMREEVALGARVRAGLLGMLQAKAAEGEADARVHQGVEQTRLAAKVTRWHRAASRELAASLFDESERAARRTDVWVLAAAVEAAIDVVAEEEPSALMDPALLDTLTTLVLGIVDGGESRSEPSERSGACWHQVDDAPGDGK